MGCDECDRQTSEPTRVAYYRIGASGIGWGNIGLIGCRKHIKLALDKLNSQ